MDTEDNEDGRPQRVQSRRHPLRQGRPKGVWQPDLVNRVPGYPKTEESYKALQERSREHFLRLHADGALQNARMGVPDGWAGKKAEGASIRAQRREEAKEIVKIMVEKNLIDPDTAANEMLAEMIAVVRDKQTVKTRERIAAAKTVLEFTRAKPAQHVNATLTKAEDFLAGLLVNGPQAT